MIVIKERTLGERRPSTRDEERFSQGRQAGRSQQGRRWHGRTEELRRRRPTKQEGDRGVFCGWAEEKREKLFLSQETGDRRLDEFTC